MAQASGSRHRVLRGGGYDAIHKWLAKHYGKADHCENQGCPQKSTMYHWAKLAGKDYEHKRENFWQLCATCHRLYDQQPDWVERMARTLSKRTNLVVCRNGHMRTEQNTYLVQRKLVSSVVCRDCRNESNRRYYASRYS